MHLRGSISDHRNGFFNAHFRPAYSTLNCKPNHLIYHGAGLAIYDRWALYFCRFPLPHAAPRKGLISRQSPSHGSRLTAFHPVANGMVERWHHFTKTAIRCHNNKEWADVLPTVLLGLHKRIKDDIGAIAAELVYGTTLRICGDFLLNKDMTPDPKYSWKNMRKVGLTPTAHRNKRSVFVQRNLYSGTHVYLRVDRIKKWLEPPY